MCPACIGSALLLLSGAGSAGGLAVVAARVLGAGRSGKQTENADVLNAHHNGNAQTDAMTTSEQCCGRE
jgi:hypothetical protein